MNTILRLQLIGPAALGGATTQPECPYFTNLHSDAKFSANLRPIKAWLGPLAASLWSFMASLRTIIEHDKLDCC